MATVLITGANRGIGLALATALTARGDTVIAASRRSSPGLDTLGVRQETVDVTDADSVRALADSLDGVVIDVLINNAGLLAMDAFGSIDFDKMVQQFVVNSTGPLRVTEALRGNLKEGSKVAIVTSRMGSISDNDSGGAYGYRMSKAAVNAGARSLSIDLRPAGIAVALLHPGWVKTDMTRGQGLVSADESAAGLIQRIDALEISTTGSFWHMNGDALPW